MSLLIKNNSQYLELADNDLNAVYNWTMAKQACEGLGPDWRLPTIDELKEIYAAKKHSNFAQWGYCCYWSCSESDEMNVKVLDGIDGSILNLPKDAENFVRPVRSIA